MCRLEAAFLAAVEKLGGLFLATPMPIWELLEPLYPEVSLRVCCICGHMFWLLILTSPPPVDESIDPLMLLALETMFSLTYSNLNIAQRGLIAGSKMSFTTPSFEATAIFLDKH